MTDLIGASLAIMLGGGKGKLTTKLVTENGTYRAQDEPVEQGEKKYDGYSSFIAAVPTYEEELEEALEELDALKECQAEVIALLAEKTGITAETCEQIKELIEEIDDDPKPDVETPTAETIEDTEDPPDPEYDPDPIIGQINSDNGEPDVSKDPNDPTVNGDGGNVRSYFALKGKGVYSVRIIKNNTFTGHSVWYQYPLVYRTTYTIHITQCKVIDGVVRESIIATQTIDADSLGNYNYPYDPDYSGDDSRPGNTKGWKGNKDSFVSNSPAHTPYIVYYAANNAVTITTPLFYLSGGGAIGRTATSITIPLT